MPKAVKGKARKKNPFYDGTVSKAIGDGWNKN